MHPERDEFRLILNLFHGMWLEYMSVSIPPEIGDVYTYERTFTKEDVSRFGDISGDQQAIHTDPNEDDRYDVALSVVCYNEDGDDVLRGDINGLFWKISECPDFGVSFNNSFTEFTDHQLTTGVIIQ